jgi:arylformamidase
MSYIDISLPVSKELPVWPGSPAPEVRLYQSMSNGSPSNNSMLSMELHGGTHFDAPLHFLPQGKSSDKSDLMSFLGVCYVADLSGSRIISAEVLENAGIPDTERLLIKTGNSALYAEKQFSKTYAALDETAARWILNRRMRLVGLDYLSIECFENNDFSVHKLLLRHDVIILEGLNLHEAAAGFYLLVALPLRLQGTEAAPVRAILLPREVLHV